MPSSAMNTSTHPFSLVLFITRIQYFTPEPSSNEHQLVILNIDSSSSPIDVTTHTVPVHQDTWNSTVDVTCQNIISPVLHAESSHKVQASIFLTQPSPTQKNWTDAYKKDTDTNLIMNHLTISADSFPPELVSTVHRCFKAHMRESRIKILNSKLVCYIPIGGTDR